MTKEERNDWLRRLEADDWTEERHRWGYKSKSGQWKHRITGKATITGHPWTWDEKKDCYTRRNNNPEQGKWTPDPVFHGYDDIDSEFSSHCIELMAYGNPKVGYLADISDGYDSGTVMVVPETEVCRTQSEALEVGMQLVEQLQAEYEAEVKKMLAKYGAVIWHEDEGWLIDSYLKDYQRSHKTSVWETDGEAYECSHEVALKVNEDSGGYSCEVRVGSSTPDLYIAPYWLTPYRHGSYPVGITAVFRTQAEALSSGEQLAEKFTAEFEVCLEDALKAGPPAEMVERTARLDDWRRQHRQKGTQEVAVTAEDF